VAGQEALIITGVFGVGKSSVAEEIAYLLEKGTTPYAVVDLDWLGWFGPEDVDLHERVLMENLAAVVDNYRAVGVQLFVVAYAVADLGHLEMLNAHLGMPVKVVRLTLPLPEIRRRLASDVTSGRWDDLREAEAWLALSRGTGFAGLTMANDRPVADVAAAILEWAGWAP
jgi:hypothetical protein